MVYSKSGQGKLISKTWFAVAVLLAAFTINVQAQQEVTPEKIQTDAVAHNEAVAPFKFKSNREKIEEAFDDYARAKNITYGVPDASGTVYFKKYTYVEANVDNPRFVQSRALAFEKAYVDALTEYVMDQFGRQMVETLREYASDDSDYQMDKPLPKDAQERVWNKSKALAEAKLDNALRKEGLDPAQYAGKSDDEKRVLFRDSILRKSITRASGSTAGIVPVQTFEARDQKGNYSVGVILRSGPSVREMAAAMRRKQLPAHTLMRSGGRAARDLLPEGDAVMDNFGVRLFFNEKGLPSLLSFGQYGFTYTGMNERQIERNKNTATMQAQELADSAITMFVNSSIGAHNENTMGEAAEEIRAIATSGNFIDSDTTRFVNRVVRNSRAVGEDTLKGRGTVFSRVMKHPTSEHYVAVVVRVWDYELAGVKVEPPKTEGAITPPKPKDDGIRIGNDYDF